MKMKTTKLKTIFLLMVVAAFPCISWSLAHAEVEWSIKQTIDLDSAPVDVAMSPDWQKMFVLTEDGEILIYSSGSAQAEKITVGGHVDRINAGPQGNVLILSSSKDNRVRVLSLDYIQKIDVSGSPYKGVDNAPVVIAVFSDFE
jgi:WD40 repeat protein